MILFLEAASANTQKMHTRALVLDRHVIRTARYYSAQTSQLDGDFQAFSISNHYNTLVQQQ
jgi:hypothetical protein